MVKASPEGNGEEGKASDSRKRNRMEVDEQQDAKEEPMASDGKKEMDDKSLEDDKRADDDKRLDDGKDADDEERRRERRRESGRREEPRREESRRGDERREEKRTNYGSQADVSNVQSSLRFLIPNSMAGSVIGKGGSVISEFQTQSGAKIVLSRTKEFFPRTQDRIIMLNGTVSSILTALHLILSKLSEEERNKGSPTQDWMMDLKIIVPNRVCGALIGRGGSTIRSFGDDSGAQLKLSSQETSQGAVGERMISISGSVEQELRAVALILAKASEDPSYLSYADVPLSYTASGGAAMYAPPRASALYNPGSAAAYPMPGMRSRSPPLMRSQISGSTTIIVAVPDEHVGAVVGKGGRTLQEITQTSGARIQVSDRGDFVEGTTNRKLTISGSADCVVSAQHLIAQKVQASIQMSEDSQRRGGAMDMGGYRADYRDDYRRDPRGDVRRDNDRGRDDRDRGRDRGRGREDDRRDFDYDRRDRRSTREDW